MEPARGTDPPLRPLAEVLGGGVVTGAIAGLAAGAIDALWSWGPAAQFVPGALSRLRFVMFSAVTDAAAGALAGLVATAILLVLSRASRIGDLLRFAWRDHNGRREGSPKPVAGLAIVLTTLPCATLALLIAYRGIAKFTAGRKAPDLVLVVAMLGALAAVAIAIPIGFVLARQLERVLQRSAEHPRLRHLSSVWAPFVAGGVLIGGGLGVWTIRQWETARVLPLRGPAVALAGALLAIAAWRVGLSLAIRLHERRALIRRSVWAGGPLVLVALVLGFGGSASVVKAGSAYTGLGGPIARTLRIAFDWDRDGYARFLGGGDCDDGDPARSTPARPRTPATASIRTASAAIRIRSTPPRTSASYRCRPAYRRTSTSS